MVGIWPDTPLPTLTPSSRQGPPARATPLAMGAATPDSYTMARALQAFLTLDQIAFYT